jgi:hypothetical protein
MKTMIMPNFARLDKRAILRAETALMLSLVWGGLAFCVLAAVAYDIRHWFAAW